MSNLKRHQIHELFETGNGSISTNKFKCEEIKENDNLTCYECGREFKSSRSMRSHKNYHDNSNLRKQINASILLTKEKTKEKIKLKNEKILSFSKKFH